MNDHRSIADPSIDSFEQRSRLFLGESVDSLGSDVLERLDAGRRAVLEEFRHSAGQPRFRTPGLWLPIGSFAVALVLAIAVLIGRMLFQAPPPEPSPAEDAELFASSEDIDLYGQDPEFYEWATGVSAPGPANDGS